MNTKAPTSQEIEELVSFLPRLYAEGFTPVIRWGGGTKDKDGVITMPWPEYNKVVSDFFQVASNECWRDCDYLSNEAGLVLKNDNVIKTADLDQIKTMLTYCVRGERFCDGHWGAMIEGGYVRQLLKRLSVLKQENA